MMTPQYIHLPPTSSLEQVSVMSPFAAIVAIDTKVTPEWRHKVSEWLVENGCLYMMAHGDECSLWDDSVDWANIEAYDFEDIPDDNLVMTTWHEDESLEEVLWFALTSVDFYPLVKHMIILDISTSSREREIFKALELTKDEIDQGRQTDIIEGAKMNESRFPEIFGAILGTLAVSALIFILLKYL